MRTDLLAFVAVAGLASGCAGTPPLAPTVLPPAETLSPVVPARAAAPAPAKPLPPTAGSPPGAAAPVPTPMDPAWRLLEPGLELGEFVSPRLSRSGDSLIHVLRIDPALFALRLMNASAPGQGSPMTAREWCRRNGLAAAINASMYQGDYLRSVSLMRTRDHVNNPRLTKDKAVLAFDALDATVPPVQIIDRDCQSFDDVGRHYGALVQSIRMVSCNGENVWAPQSRESSTAAIAVDRRARILFIHVRSPFTTHDLIDVLLGLPLDLKNAMYVEGGPEAQMYVRSGGAESEFVGALATGFREADDSARAWPVPNVVGIARLAKH